MLVKGNGYDMIALDLRIAMSIFGVISCIQFILNAFFQVSYN